MARWNGLFCQKGLWWGRLGLSLRLNFTEDIGRAKAVRDYGLNLYEAESIFVSDKTLRERRAFSRPSFSVHKSSLADS